MQKNVTTDPSRSPSENTSESTNRALLEWAARIQFDKHELGCSFSVCLFLGEPPKDPEEWLTAANFAGAHSAYVSAGRGYGQNRNSKREDTSEGFVNLDPAIARLSGLGSFDPEFVVPYLKEKLQWRVQKADTEPAELQSLEVVVLATPLTLPPGEVIPVPGKPKRYDEITWGKVGGSREEAS